MLLELARYLQGFARFFALFDYLTMRAILGALTALSLSLWLGPTVIERLAKMHPPNRFLKICGEA